MANKAAKLVSEALLGLDVKTVVINGKGYSIAPPTIKIMCLGFKEWAKITINTQKQTNIEMIAQIPEIVEHQLKGISYFVDHSNADKLYKEWMEGDVTEHEINSAINIIMGSIDSESVFRNAQGCLSAVKIIARPK